MSLTLTYDTAWIDLIIKWKFMCVYSGQVAYVSGVNDRLF